MVRPKGPCPPLPPKGWKLPEHDWEQERREMEAVRRRRYWIDVAVMALATALVIAWAGLG